MTNLFEQLSNADVQNRGLKINEPELGEAITYVVRLDDVKLQESNRGMGTLFIPEFTIKQGTQKTPTGASYSWVQFPTNRPQTDPGNIKSFVAACLGLQASEDIPPAEFKAATEGKFNGTLLNLTVEHIQTKTGRDFYAHTWAPFHGDLASEIPEVPEIPTTPESLTKDEWLDGEGPGVTHPSNPSYEYNPDYLSWGVRIKK